MTAHHIDERHTVRYLLPADSPRPVGDLTAAIADAQRDYCTRNQCGPEQLPHNWAQVRVQDGHVVITFTVEQAGARRVLDLTGAATQLLPRVGTG